MSDFETVVAELCIAAELCNLDKFADLAVRIPDLTDDAHAGQIRKAMRNIIETIHKISGEEPDLGVTSMQLLAQLFQRDLYHRRVPIVHCPNCKTLYPEMDPEGLRGGNSPSSCCPAWQFEVRTPRG